MERARSHFIYCFWRCSLHGCYVPVDIKSIYHALTQWELFLLPNLVSLSSLFTAQQFHASQMLLSKSALRT